MVGVDLSSRGNGSHAGHHSSTKGLEHVRSAVDRLVQVPGSLPEKRATHQVPAILIQGLLVINICLGQGVLTLGTHET